MESSNKHSHLDEQKFTPVFLDSPFQKILSLDDGEKVLDSLCGSGSLLVNHIISDLANWKISEFRYKELASNMFRMLAPGGSCAIMVDEEEAAMIKASFLDAGFVLDKHVSVDEPCFGGGNYGTV